jgi:hypothetical protein
VGGQWAWLTPLLDHTHRALAEAVRREAVWMQQSTSLAHLVRPHPTLQLVPFL